MWQSWALAYASTLCAKCNVYCSGRCLSVVKRHPTRVYSRRMFVSAPSEFSYRGRNTRKLVTCYSARIVTAPDFPSYVISKLRKKVLPINA